jgi:short-subunit dehydrogenase
MRLARAAAIAAGATAAVAAYRRQRSGDDLTGEVAVVTGASRGLGLLVATEGHGRIVTITSIGGKLSVPHLLPYSTAKFAAVGFSEGLRAAHARMTKPEGE